MISAPGGQAGSGATAAAMSAAISIGSSTRTVWARMRTPPTWLASRVTVSTMSVRHSAQSWKSPTLGRPVACLSMTPTCSGSKK
ncbi:hypothetical protein ACFYOK_16755 [Microbispora bryophytorum]|uniref:hypothetical protein n=1 Tax=Microbispora bryophytorum TaxID=1460882 RepID=UPI0033FB2F7B